MLKLLRKIAQEDAATKLLFDHVRNLSISAAVLGAAVWKYRNGVGETTHYFDLLIVATLGLFGVFLFLVNQVTGLENCATRVIQGGFTSWFSMATPLLQSV